MSLTKNNFPFSCSAPLKRSGRTRKDVCSGTYCGDWEAFDRDNTHIWNPYYRPKPLFDHISTWEDWFAESRQIIMEVQEIYEEHKAQGTWKKTVC